MSMWSYVFGTVKVLPGGSSQHAKEFILREVIDHLPEVTGSEGSMRVSVVCPDPRSDFDMATSFDEFGQPLKRMRRVASEYVLVVDGHLRDRSVAQTNDELWRWLTTLARRVMVSDLMIRTSGDFQEGGRMYDESLLGNLQAMYRRGSFDGEDPMDGFSLGRCPDWRCGYMPDFENSETGNWTEILASLMPGARSALRMQDLLLGHRAAAYESDENLAKQVYARMSEVMSRRESGELPWRDDESASGTEMNRDCDEE